MKRKHDNRFKSKVALEALRGEKTIAQIASEYEVHPNQVGQWKKKLLENIPDLFSSKKEKKEQKDYSEDELLRQIGKLKVENDFLRKKYEQWLGRIG